MTSLEKIEQAISALTPKEIEALAAWFAEFRGDLWDRQFEADVESGKLDKLAEEAAKHHHAGRTTPL